MLCPGHSGSYSEEPGITKRRGKVVEHGEQKRKQVLTAEKNPAQRII